MLVNQNTQRRSDTYQNSPSITFSLGESKTHDLQTHMQTPMTNMDSWTAEQPPTETESERRTKVIWGTTINIGDILERFKTFVRTFTLGEYTAELMHIEEYMMNEEKAYYYERIREICETNTNILEINCDHLCVKKYHALLDMMIAYPNEIIPLFEYAVMDLCLEMIPEYEGAIQIQVYNTHRVVALGNIDPKNIDQLVEVRCLVLKTSQIIPEITVAAFECVNCREKTKVEEEKGQIKEPEKCMHCLTKFSMKQLHTEGKFVDKQIIHVQEHAESMATAYTAQTQTIVATRNMVDAVRPGDKIVATAIVRTSGVRLNYKDRVVKNIFRTYLELIHAKIEHEEYVRFDTHEIVELQKNKDIYEMLWKSIAPSIYGKDDVKKSILLQMMGGVSKKISNTAYRGNIHILLAGDPGLGKSQLLQFVTKVEKRGIYASGKGSSAVGLTACVTKDTETNTFVLEPGALVLADDSICCIDEFDKMNDTTRSALHEAMEQQTVSIAKAGIITTLNARTSVLASCNPKDSHYNHRKSIIENINIQPSLLSRFDVVCIMLDKHDTAADKNISMHVLDMYTRKKKTSTCSLSVQKLAAYVKIARKLEPALTEDAKKLISETYCEMRMLNNGKSITATTRQLESIIRLSEAHAKVRFSLAVEEQDVLEAVRIIKDSILLYAIDPNTGVIDLDLVHTDKTKRNATN